MPLESHPRSPAVRKDISVFVSYCRKDLDVVIHDIRWLESMGFRVWYDEAGIEPGNPDWDETITRAVKQASVFLFFLSRNSNDSKYCKIEGAIARKHEKQFIAVEVEEVAISPKFEALLVLSQTIKRYDNYQGYQKNLLSALTGNPAETPRKSGFIKTHRLCLLALMSAALGIFILPAGLAALAFGLRALINKRAAPMGQGWIWATRIAVAVGLVQTLVILSALLDGFGRAGVGG